MDRKQQIADLEESTLKLEILAHIRGDLHDDERRELERLYAALRLAVTR